MKTDQIQSDPTRTINSKIPDGKLSEKWRNYKDTCRLVSPANKKKMSVIVIGSGLAGSSTAATLAEQGYQVKVFCFQDSARRAHSVAAQGGINAAKNYKYDGDSIYRMFYDTVKGGDFRSREANVYRLAECSNAVIDQLTALGVPFGREYSGYLANRSFGGVQVQRTFYSRGATGQQLLLGTYSQLSRNIAVGNVQMFPRHEMMDLVLIDGKAKGVIVRDLETGKLQRHSAHAVVLATGGYGKIYYLSTLAMGCNASAAWRAYKKGASFAGVSWVQFHPTSLPQSGDHQSKLTLMSESLRNDGRIWTPLKPGDTRHPNEITESGRDYYLERKYPAFGNLCPRDIASRAAMERIDSGHGVGRNQNAVYLDFKDAIHNQGKNTIQSKYGNLFSMYKKITNVDAYEQPMLISPSAHFTMGGLWVDYELMTQIPGLYAIGEVNFSDHGANRLGANSLLQACVDGYFILPHTINNYLADEIGQAKADTGSPEFVRAEASVHNFLNKLINVRGKKSPEEFHRQLGQILWNYCGMSRSESQLNKGLKLLAEIKKEFWSDICVYPNRRINSDLEKAGRVIDFIELGELMCRDALEREESCGAHFRSEHQTQDGEGIRDDENFSHVMIWTNANEKDTGSILTKEPLQFDEAKVITRNYKK